AAPDAGDGVRVRLVEAEDDPPALAGQRERAAVVGQVAAAHVVPYGVLTIAVAVDGGQVATGEGAQREGEAQVVEQAEVGGAVGGGVHVDVDRVDDRGDRRRVRVQPGGRLHPAPLCRSFPDMCGNPG